LIGVFNVLKTTTMPMIKDRTLSPKISKINLNQSPGKMIIEALMSYSKSIQCVPTSIGKIIVVNN
jgi:hypothetical protein